VLASQLLKEKEKLSKRAEKDKSSDQKEEDHPLDRGEKGTKQVPSG